MSFDTITGRRIITELKRGSDPKSIVNKLFVLPSLVSYYRKKLRIPEFRRGRRKGYLSPVTAKHRARIRVLRRKGWTQAEIASVCGVSNQSISKHLKSMAGWDKFAGLKITLCGNAVSRNTWS